MYLFTANTVTVSTTQYSVIRPMQYMQLHA